MATSGEEFACVSRALHELPFLETDCEPEAERKTNLRVHHKKNLVWTIMNILLTRVIIMKPIHLNNHCHALIPVLRFTSSSSLGRKSRLRKIKSFKSLGSRYVMGYGS
jgi:hypothetical protein